MAVDTEMERLTLTGEREPALKEGREFQDLDDDDDDDGSDGSDDFEAAGFSPAEERRLLKKLDRRVVLVISGLYLFSFLDRSSTLDNAP
jgi:hypothetical protein